MEFINDAWSFCDTGELVEETHSQRSCGYCGKDNTKEGYDGCLGTLPEVMNACCGHGIEADAYIQFLDGTCITGQETKVMFDEIKIIPKLNNL